MNKVNYPFWVVVNKEISDHVKSWRFIILMGIILLTCMGSLFFCAVYQLSGAIVGDCAGIRCYKFGTEQGDVEPYAVTACSS